MRVSKISNVPDDKKPVVESLFTHLNGSRPTIEGSNGFNNVVSGDIEMTEFDSGKVVEQFAEDIGRKIADVLGPGHVVTVSVPHIHFNWTRTS